jgi:hypothetical protein
MEEACIVEEECELYEAEEKGLCAAHAKKRRRKQMTTMTT